MGKVGLPLLLKNSEGKWIETPASIVTERKRNSTIIINGTAVQIDLRNEGAVSIETQLLKTRVNAKTLVALETYFLDLTQFVSYLAHIQGFVLPLALGDTYFALGDYEKAATYYIKVRDYPYLNLSIERPMVWYKLARTYLQMGNRLYRIGTWQVPEPNMNNFAYSGQQLRLQRSFV
jgi:tetratricopeptide (TPR) repeat protein